MATTIPAHIIESMAGLPAFFGYDVASRETGLSTVTLRRYAECGRLHVLKTAPASGGGGRVLISKLELARFLSTLAAPIGKSA